MESWLAVILVSVASVRVTRLATTDTLLAGPRDRLKGWFEARKEKRTGVTTEDTWQSKWAYMIGCSWCTGTWIAIAVTVATDMATDVPYPVLTAATAAYTAGRWGAQ